MPLHDHVSWRVVEAFLVDAGSDARGAEMRAILRLTDGMAESRYVSFARTEHVNRLYFVQYLGTERYRRNPWRSLTIVGDGDWTLRAMVRKAENSDGPPRAGPEPSAINCGDRSIPRRCDSCRKAL